MISKVWRRKELCSPPSLLWFLPIFGMLGSFILHRFFLLLPLRSRKIWSMGMPFLAIQGCVILYRKDNGYGIDSDPELVDDVGDSFGRGGSIVGVQAYFVSRGGIMEQVLKRASLMARFDPVNDLLEADTGQLVCYEACLKTWTDLSGKAPADLAGLLNDGDLYSFSS